MNEIRVTVTKHTRRAYLMMHYVDPVTFERHYRSTKTNDEKKAERKAAVWQEELNSGAGCVDAVQTWEDFRELYERQRRADVAKNTLDNTRRAFDHLERIINPARLHVIREPQLKKFVNTLELEGVAVTTINTYLSHVHTALAWAKDNHLLKRAPSIKRRRQARGKKKMRGRPIVLEEFERMLAAVRDVRPKVADRDSQRVRKSKRRDVALWRRYLRGLWLSGLRLEESLALSWDADAGFSVDLSGDYPCFKIAADAQKSRKAERCPMTPDFAAFLLKTPPEQRIGRVFPIRALKTGALMTPKRVCRVISEIGAKAGVVVDNDARVAKRDDDGNRVFEKVVKFASAHDLRRSFGTRWARKVTSFELQKLMRHASIRTTEEYYVDVAVDELAKSLWERHGAAAQQSRNTSTKTSESASGHDSDAKEKPVDSQRVN